ncbi:uncharacterized protein LOC131430311 isoform X2 [Malaya genurostris]|uniref:uncharacterized protein LOC131430311 isoform X2 n=1 Tax=Malaya genurostris TaxID=325434 RepID=UPI0026F3D546|nr:uncharacterized protein LOC131430311 isoform X2 [Malaya genurostris]
MVESEETASSASLRHLDDLKKAEFPDNDIAASESYNLIILVKSLELVDSRNDVQRKLRITMMLGDSEVEIVGTESEINQQRQGNAVSIPCENAEQFKQYLLNHDLEVAIKHEDVELGRSSIHLAEVNLATFDPAEFEPTVISKTFPLEHSSAKIGTIHLILKTDREKSNVELNASKIENDSLLFIVNDSPKRRSSEYQEETIRQMLTCLKCNALRSPSEISCRYELIDGILANCERSKQDPDLEMMKRKIEQIEREARLYPAGKVQEPPKEPEEDRFCNTCGGYTVTGVTCNPLLRQLEPVQIYPEGSAKRFEEFEPSKHAIGAARISEPNFVSRRRAGSRNSLLRGEDNTFNTIPHQDHQDHKICPRSVGTRFCQRCGLNLDWIPLQAHCPKCGFKCHPKRPGSPLPKADELTPSVMNSWMGDFEFGDIQRRHSSALVAGGRSASLDGRHCPICRLRGGKCPDCERRKLPEQNGNTAQNSSTQSSTSDSEILARKAINRPKTRQSLRDRFSSTPKKITKATRMAHLKKAYGEEADSKHEKSGRRSTRSSVVSLNVEEILKKADAHKNKIISGGIQSVELRKVGSRSRNSTSDTLDRGCSILSAAQIRKNQRSLLRRIKKQNSGKYSYRYGNRYPGISVGHRECILRGNPVPPHMGWQWNVSTPGIGRIRKGWRPGAVRKPIKELMQHFLVSYPLDNIPVSKRGKSLLKKGETETDPTKQKPTLQIVKRNGEYVVVMNPLKDAATLKTAQDPYLACQPIRFKLAKDPNMGKLYQLRNALKVKGFTLCGCPEIESCTHRSEKEKKLLKQELRKLSKRFGLARSTEIKDVPVDSESELDLEFTPPSAMLKTGTRKPDVVCTETQYCEEDYKVQIPADKLKCKPGRVDPRDMNAAGRVKVGRGLDKDSSKGGKGVGKGGAGKGGAGKGGVGKGGAGKGATGKDGAGKDGAGKGAAGKGGSSRTTGKFAGIPVGAVGARIKPCQAEVICDTNRFCAPAQYCYPTMSTGYSCQVANSCYTSPCAPAAVCGYNACYMGF